MGWVCRRHDDTIITKRHNSKDKLSLSTLAMYRLGRSLEDARAYRSIQASITRYQTTYYTIPATRNYSSDHNALPLFLHHNHETVINELRQMNVINRLRQSFKAIRNTCQRCKNQNTKPLPAFSLTSDLPSARLAALIRPFSYTGTDCFDPIEVKVGRKVEKRWCMIFTCLTVRAIHIQLVNSLTTDSCILAIRCFIARRGCPAEIVSDNGTIYRGANNELLRCLETIDNNQIKDGFAQIKLTFIPPHALHMGGACERMNPTIKSYLYEVLRIQTHRTTDKTLRCVLA